MPGTMKIIEGLPEAYPATPSGLSTAAAALAPALIWQRIEAYVAHRWSARDVRWVVEGPCDWHPTLEPVDIATTEVWSRAGEWEPVELAPTALGGFRLLASGPYRFTGTAGEDSTVPEIVNEAYRRLAEYMSAKPGKPGARHERISAGSVGLSHTRHEAWAARAMQNSGAGDLLRLYRRA